MDIAKLHVLRVLTYVYTAETVTKVRMIHTPTTPEVSHGPA